MRKPLVGLVVLMIFCMGAAAAEFPARPIRFIVPSAAGGTPDINARLLAAELSKQMGQQVVVDNRPGAANAIGTEMVVKAVPDGHTIGYATVSLAINRSFLSRLPYDPAKDLQVIAQLGYQPNLLAVTPAMPIRSIGELIDYARANPGRLSFGSAGNGSTLHLSMELFKLMSGTQIVHVPYKAAQQAITEMIGGHVQLVFDNLGSILPHVKAGRVRALAVSGPSRAPVVPELPTVAEAGVPGFEVTVWGGVMAPAGLPKAILTTLNAEINKALASPTLKEKFGAIGYQLVGGTPEQFDVFVNKEVVKWADVIKRSGAKID